MITIVKFVVSFTPEKKKEIEYIIARVLNVKCQMMREYFDQFFLGDRYI